MKVPESISRVLIVGQGSIGKRHLRLARNLMPDADIRVLRHRDNEAVPEFANDGFSRLDDAISFAPQIAVIANPATFHLDVALPLARAGANLLVEKPLSATLNDVTRLLDTCRERGTVLMIGYNLRFFPSLRQFRDLLGQNSIGRVLSVRCEIGQYLPSWRPDTDYRQGVSARKGLGGGALLELSHEIDYLRWIFGDVEWVQAALSKQSALEIDVEDTVHLILGFVPGTDGRRLVGTLSMDFIRYDTTRICTAIGEAGSLRWNGIRGSIERFDPEASEWSEIFCHPHKRDDSYLDEWKNFFECINGNAAPLVAGEDGLRVLQIIEAVRQASVSGAQTKVEKEMPNGRINA
jgi:predicted dehydrogenase